MIASSRVTVAKPAIAILVLALVLRSAWGSLIPVVPISDSIAYDTMAQAAVLDGIHAGFDRTYDPVQRKFFYMPLVHAEDRRLQEEAIVAFATLAAAIPEEERAPVIQQVIMGARHRNVIVRFGRFPHRNAILGRESTPAEIAFLEEPGSSF